MPDTTKDEPMTRFLMYKVALQVEDHELIATCLKVISSSSLKDPALLYACVLEAQKLGQKRQAVEALHSVVEYAQKREFGTINITSLLRITIKLLNSLLADEENDGSGKYIGSKEGDVERLCGLFETGTTCLCHCVLSFNLA